MTLEFALKDATPLNTCAFAVHKDLPILASASGPNFDAVRVWDLESRTCIRSLRDLGNSRIIDLAFDPNCRQLATIHANGFVNLWDFESGEVLKTFEAHRLRGHSVAWDPTGRFLASSGWGGFDLNIKVWDASGDLQYTLHHDSLLSSTADLVSHPTEDFFASGSYDKIIRIRRWSTGADEHELRGHTGRVCSLAASTTWLMSASYDATICIWRWATGEHIHTIRGFKAGFDSRCLSWRGSTLAILCHNKIIQVWDTSDEDPTNWARVETPTVITTKSTWGLAMLKDGRVACETPTGALIAVWKVL